MHWRMYYCLPCSNVGLLPIRYRRDFSVSVIGSAKLEPCRYMPDIVSAELTSYRYDIVKYRADTIIGADICMVCNFFFKEI